MSEKEKEREEMKGENIILDHFSHRHPLILTKIGRNDFEICDGCLRYINPAETAYTCSKKCTYPILHEACAEMPREMRLSIHPQHTLIQKKVENYDINCAVCDSYISVIGYCCRSDDFQIHVGCAQNTVVMRAAAGGKRIWITHPSHPQHELVLLWRPGRSGLLRCDACATIHKGISYVCVICQYFINESCAALPPTTTYHHHHHPLSLAYHLPLKYIKCNLVCALCYRDLLPKYWVYHCEICRYVVHIKCAIQTSRASTSNIDVNAEGVITFPIDNNKALEKLIVPFVMKNLGGSILGTPPHSNEMVRAKYKFHNHDHELSLISSSSSSSLSLHDIEEEEEKENSDADEDDDDLNFGNQLEIPVCDGCTLPIKCSSSSSNEYYYMSCGECKYFLHWECFHLPPELPSHPLHLKPHHTLTLQTPPKLDLTYCDICRSYTNGLFYGCTECSFEADIKCASLPDTIQHAAHPQHHFKLLTAEITNERSYIERMCAACGGDIDCDVCYSCYICEIIMHASCALLPATVTNPVWDKHPLPLTFDASVNHPGGFYCDICEQEMNPEMLMYHCRLCDFSLHPRCFPNASGEYRNLKFGQRYAVAAVHRHPVTHQLVTNKLRCDVCGKRKAHGSRGFQCHSHKCEFFMCLHPCGRERLDSMQAVD